MGDRVIVALSWYLFKADTLQPVYWALAAQTIVPIDDLNRFTLSLEMEPPEDAFVLTGADSFLDLPADGNLALGFITVVPMAATEGPFTWNGDDRTESSCPYEDLLVAWWDGPELDSERTGFREGILRKGLNLVDLSKDGEFRDEYVLYPAERTIQIPICEEGLRAPLRSCGLESDRSVETLFFDVDTPDDEIFRPMEGDYLCGACGSSYRVPNLCTRRFDVLCRDCRSLVVETDPDRPARDWPCAEVPTECDDPDPLCIWGRLYRCVDDGWVHVATCSDDCCEDRCQNVDIE